MIQLICKCGTPFKVKNNRAKTAKYCSNKCKGEAHVGNKNPFWKGDSISYSGIHHWIKNVLGKATHCENCGASQIPNGKKRFFEWANISGKYKRETTDWKQLCVICHRGFDEKAKVPKSEVIPIKMRYEKGESQKSIAKDYGVCQMTISDIVNDKIQSYAF